MLRDPAFLSDLAWGEKKSLRLCGCSEGQEDGIAGVIEKIRRIMSRTFPHRCYRILEAGRRALRRRSPSQN
jgi:hypothetical protein